MKTVHWGIIGMGRFGILHARTLRDLPGSELVAFSNRNPERLAAAAREFGEAKAYSDFRRLLDDPAIDAVSIVTHWQDHYEVAREALASGKHILLEKPMAATVAQCRDLISLAESAKGFFLVGHICRFDPRVALAKEAIDAGRIGRIVSMRARRNLPKAPGHIRLDKISPLMGDGVHDADLMMWFVGQSPTGIYGRNIRAGDYRYPDLGWAMLHFGDDAIGVIETVWMLPEKTPTTIDAKFEVIGTEGTLAIDGSQTGLTVLDANGPKAVDTVYWPAPHGRQKGALAAELAYFADCIRTGRAPSVITPVEAGRAVAAMDAAERSSERKQPVQFSFL